MRPPPAGPAGILSRIWTQPWWGVAMLALLLQLAWPGLTARIDTVLVDALVRPVTLEPQSRILAFDETSLATLGRWPWRRDVHAALMEQLRVGQASAVAYNVLFSEATDQAADAALGAAVAGLRERLVLPLAPEAGRAGELLGRTALPQIQGSARTGHVDVPLDADGRVRRMYLRATPAGGPTVDAMAWETLKAAGLAAAQMPGLQSGKGANRMGAWLRSHEVLIPALAQAVPMVIYDGRPLDPAALRGRVLFVGPVARGLGPEFRLPGSDQPQPSVVVLAHSYEVLRAGAQLTLVPPWVQAVLLLACLLPMGWWRLQAGRGQQWLPWVTAFAPLALAAALAAWGRVWWDPGAVVLALSLAAVSWLVAAMRQSEHKAWRSRLDASAALAAIGEGVVVLDHHGRVQIVNPVARGMAGTANPVGLAFEDAFALKREVGPASGRLFPVDPAASPVPQKASLTLVPHGQTQSREVLVTAAALADAQGRADGVVLALRDVTELLAASRVAQHAATHDALTGLPNRNLLMDRLAQSLARVARRQGSVAVLFLDVDRFKRVNDSLGHATGDEMLKEVGRRLRAACRAQDTVARWGGDEFVVVMEDVGGRQSAWAAVSKLVDSVGQDVQLSGMSFPCSCSVGVALAPEDAGDAESLLAMADTAMYRAKSHPARRWEFYSKSLDRWTRDRMAMENELRSALREHRFALHYQPQLRLTDGRMEGLEALLRLHRDEEEVLSPKDFLAVAEDSPLILDIGEWVIWEAAEQAARWTRDGGPVVPISVNVSARQCLDPRLIGTLEQALSHAGVAPQRMKIEITETAAMTEPALVQELLTEVSRMGVGIALDDFGTGYSSLVHLRRFPIQQIKIDRSFVHDLEQGAEDASIVKAILALSQSLRIPVVAEGVETLAQSRTLSSLGCELVQGFYYSRPIPAPQVKEWMAVRA